MTSFFIFPPHTMCSVINTLFFQVCWVCFSLKSFWVTRNESFCSLSLLTYSKNMSPSTQYIWNALEIPLGYISHFFLSANFMQWNRNVSQQCVAACFCRTAWGEIPWRIRGCLISYSLGINSHVLVTLSYELLNCRLCAFREEVSVVCMRSENEPHEMLSFPDTC